MPNWRWRYCDGKAGDLQGVDHPWSCLDFPIFSMPDSWLLANAAAAADAATAAWQILSIFSSWITSNDTYFPSSHDFSSLLLVRSSSSTSSISIVNASQSNNGQYVYLLPAPAAINIGKQGREVRCKRMPADRLRGSISISISCCSSCSNMMLRADLAHAANSSTTIVYSL